MPCGKKDNGFTCCRPSGHAGEHAAELTNDIILHTWIDRSCTNDLCTLFDRCKKNADCATIKNPTINCPFCGEGDFDLVGLKIHITCSWCDAFNELNVNDIYEHPLNAKHGPDNLSERLIEKSELDNRYHGE